MSNPADGAHEVYFHVVDEGPIIMAAEQEMDTTLSLPDGASARDKSDTIETSFEGDADFGELADTVDEDGIALADGSTIDLDGMPPFTPAGQLEIPRQPEGNKVEAIGKTAVTPEVVEDTELDLDPDEDRDFEKPTLDGKPVPTDLVDAYRQSMTGRILEHEEIIERAQIVEAGKTAEQMLRVYDAIDSKEEDALTEFRESYIQDREQNIILYKKDSDKDDDTEIDEPAAQLSEDGKPLSKAKLTELQAAKNRKIKHDMAVEEVDDLIAFALQHRMEAESGMLADEDPCEFRRDLEVAVEQGVRARHDMIDSISRWTFKQSMKYVAKAARAGIKPIDVIQEGNIGAIRAVDKFDWKLGYKLSTYSDLWIKQSIDKAIAAQSEIRKPQHIAEKLTKIFKKEQELRALLQPGEELTEETIADALDMTPEDLAEFRKWDQQSVSLDKRMGDGDPDDTTLGENFQDDDAETLEEQIVEHDRQLRLEEALDVALSSVVKNPRREFVLRARFGLDDPDGNPRSRSDIAKDLGCTPQNVKILEEKALEKIRGHRNIMQLLAELR